MNIEEIFGKDYSTFETVDPYNKQNTVSGFISRKATEYYGALIITKINNKEVPEQLIMGTPKMHYPFWTIATGERKYQFPSAQTIEVYEKLDGTNILAFLYTDGINQFMSFKTRLLPFVNAESRWGNFYEMWNEVAKNDFGIIRDIMRMYKCNLSFELYGIRNSHLVLYDVSLAYAFLFGVTNAGRIYSPHSLLKEEIIPFVRRIEVIDKDYVWNYESLQKDLQKNLKKLDENSYSGIEGAVWYLKTNEGKVIQLKCKPETIEAIHFSQGKGISFNSILATCWNALENTEGITVDFIKQLLKEEFDDRKIEANHYLIEKAIDTVKRTLDFRNIVLEKYNNIGINVHLDKVGAMRKMSEFFDRKEMGKVYSTIINWG